MPTLNFPYGTQFRKLNASSADCSDVYGVKKRSGDSDRVFSIRLNSSNQEDARRRDGWLKAIQEICAG